MKCQHCEKPATFHVTELTGPEPVEFHLCADHARMYLQPGTTPPLDSGLSIEEPDFSSPGDSGEGLTAEELLAQLEALAAEEIKKKPPSKKSKSAKSLTGKAAKLGKVAANLEELDQRTCPHCGITYREFRQKGRLGCPHDYDFFAIELEPLLYNIHGKKEHLGKRPQEGARTAQQQTELVRLKREMQAAVEREDYELAARLRDQIRKQEG